MVSHSFVHSSVDSFVRSLMRLFVYSFTHSGDFLVWCHLPISPEPLLVDYISNFPNNLSSVDDVAPQHNHWVIDEVRESNIFSLL